LFQFLATVVGAHLFAREYGWRLPLLLPVGMAATFLPYQWLLGVSSVRAVYREVRRRNDWEMTAHVGAHRRGEAETSSGSAQRQGWRSAGAVRPTLSGEVARGQRVVGSD